MEKLSLTAIGRSARRVVIGSIKATGDTAKAIVEASRDVPSLKHCTKLLLLSLRISKDYEL